jgi:phosphoglucosamine mutase
VPGTDSGAHLFGTDGIRGTAGRFPLDPPTVRRVGAALVRAVSRAGVAPQLLIGRDTRESGSWIETELAWGATGEGATVASAGIVPTPAVAYLTRTAGYDIGVVISASHNPFEDNGIKVFSGRGEKFTDHLEREVEAIVSDGSWTARTGDPTAVPRVDLIDAYLDHLRAVVPEADSLRGFRLGIDCANGATTTVAPALFASLGLDLVVVNDRPDGRNINLDSGSTHPQGLATVVVRSGCHAAVAFDGDGDRAIFVDDRGEIVNGDAVLFMCARQLQQEGRLKGNAVVATVMSNIGLEIALRTHGIDLVRCPVGDKYVMEEMLKRDLSLGGEQSGHIIFSDYLFTGDGLCTALNVLRTLALSGATLRERVAELVNYPQILLNVPVKKKVDLRHVPAVAAVIERVEARVDRQGRLLVRYSGTEPLLRVMIEGKHEPDIRAWAQEIVDVVREHLG